MSERFYNFDILEAPQAIQEEVYQRVKVLIVSDFPTDTTVFEKLAAWYPPTVGRVPGRHVGRVRIELSGSYRTVWDNHDMPVPVLTHFESVSDAVRLEGGYVAANTIGGWHVSAMPVPVDFFETEGRLKDLAGYPATEVQLAEIYSRVQAQEKADRYAQERAEEYRVNNQEFDL